MSLKVCKHLAAVGVMSQTLLFWSGALRQADCGAGPRFLCGYQCVSVLPTPGSPQLEPSDFPKQKLPGI